MICFCGEHATKPYATKPYAMKENAMKERHAMAGVQYLAYMKKNIIQTHHYPAVILEFFVFANLRALRFLQKIHCVFDEIYEYAFF